MIATIAVVLIGLWVVGYFAFKMTKGLIHVLLVVGAVLLVLHFAH
jgi:hypothetical protein